MNLMYVKPGQDQLSPESHWGIEMVATRKLPDGAVLRAALESGIVFDADGGEFPLHSGLANEALVKLQWLVRQDGVTHTLEVGMACGMSTLGILYALTGKDRARHVAIDPYQQKTIDYFDPSKPPPTKDGHGGVGLAMVERAELSDGLEFDNRPSYLALPDLVAQGRKFDLVFIDAYHTFDYAFVDYFYSDLLLREGGYLVFDDWMLPNVHKVCWFLETHKDYELIGPEHDFPLKPSYRARLWWQNRLGRRAPRNAVPEWGSIIAYRKRSSTMVRPLYFHSEFYPYFRRWWLLKNVRSTLASVIGRPNVRKPPPWE